MNQIKKNISILLTTLLVVMQVMLPRLAVAAPPPPSAPNAPSAPGAPSAPSSPSAPTQPPAPSSPHSNPQPTPTPTKAPKNTPTPTPTQGETTETPPTQSASNIDTGADSTNTSTVSNENETTVETNNNAEIQNDLVAIGSTGGNASNKNTGDGVVVSGDVNMGANVENIANQTHTSLPGCGASSCTTIGSGQAVTNSNTGSNSNNNAAVSNGSTTDITNNNTANLDTGMIVIADTGRNSADKNTGSGYVESGDVNVGLTVVNVANTDILGVTTSEFNVVDNHSGDIVIDFANLSATPVNGNGASADNNQTGANSNNNATVDNNSSFTVINNNDAQVVSDIVVDAITGHNSADKNTGNGIVQSGDANIITNVVNLVNNTLTSGAEILIATVNVFGDWIGDLILTDSSSSNNLAGCGDCSQNAAAGNSKTGADSNNTSSITNNKVTELETNNSAEIGNGIILNANTGSNFADKNTGGAHVQTGDINAVASVNTVANTNTEGTWWIVIVNEAGRWIGHILGADDSGNLAQAGTVDLGASNESTGAGSDNAANISNNEYTSITQNNNANVDTNIVINADTGHNSAQKNTGEGHISTGDVNVASNIVNFVNNNLAGGKVILTFVNVFGSWIGDAVTPNAVAQGSNNSDNNSAGNGTETNSETTIIVDSSSSYESNNSGTSKKTNVIYEYEYIYEYENYQVDNATGGVDYLGQLTTYNSRNQVLSAASNYNSQTSDRVAAGQWLIDVDQNITVTPSPIASSSLEGENTGGLWWRVLAGLSISILAVVSSQFRQMAAWLPRS